MRKSKRCRRQDGSFKKCPGKTAKGKKAKRKTRTPQKRQAVTLVYLAGPGCRDGEGVFVPVPQCRVTRKKLTKPG